MAGAGRYTKVIKLVREAEDLARSGALVLDDGAAAIYFLWGQPSHAYVKVDGERVEGDAALKEIALSLGRPGKVTWKSKDVMQVETLRCNADDLVDILEAMSKAPTAAPPPPPRPASPAFGKPEPSAPPKPVAAKAPDQAEPEAAGEAAEPAAEAAPSPPPPPPPVSWAGDERRRGPALRYSLSDFPLLPSGPTLWSDVPTSVVHLDVLLGTLQTVLVVLEASQVRAAGVVADGERYDAIYIDPDGVKTGRVAWELMIGNQDGTVSAYEVDPAVARTLPVLWRNRVVHRDLDTSWINRAEFLAAQRGDEEDRAVIIATPDVIGIGLLAQGEVVGAFSTETRLPHPDLSLLQALLDQDVEARVTVLERIPEDVGEPYKVEAPDEAPLAEEEDLAEVAAAFSFQPIDGAFAAAPETLSAAGAVPEPEPAPLTPFAEVASPAEAPAGETPAFGAGEPAPAFGAEEPAFATAEEPAAAAAAEPAGAADGGMPAAGHDEEPVFETVAESPFETVSEAELEAGTGSAAAAEPVTFSLADLDEPTAAAPDEPEPGFETVPPHGAWGSPADTPGFEGAAAPPAGSDDIGALVDDLWGPSEGASAESGAENGHTTAETHSDEGAAGESGAADHGATSESAEPAPAEQAPATSPTGSLPFAPAGSNVGLTDFASFLTGSGSAPPPAAPAAAGAAQHIPPQRHLPPEPVAADAESSEPPGPPDFPAIVAELVSIGTRFLGPDFAIVQPLLTEAPHTAAGLRTAIAGIRRSEVPNQPPETVQSMARAMVLYVADRVTAV